MGDRKALLDVTKDGCCVVVDGLDLSDAVRRVLLTAQAGEPPTLVLELSTQAFRVDAGGARVGVSPVGEHILTQLGWRPPGERPDLGEHLRVVSDAVRNVWQLASGWKNHDDTEQQASDVFTALSPLVAWEAGHPTTNPVLGDR